MFSCFGMWEGMLVTSWAFVVPGVLHNLPRSGIHVGVSKLPHEVAGRLVLGGLPFHLMLRSRYNHVLYDHLLFFT